MAKSYVWRRVKHREDTISIFSMLWQIWFHLSRRRRLQLPQLAVLTLLSGLAEAVTLGTVLPFLGIIVAPTEIFKYTLASRLATGLGVAEPSQLVLLLTIVFAVVALLAGFLRLLVLWCNKNYAQWVGYELAINIYRRTLYQPYQVHAARNTSELISSIEKINRVTVALTQVLMLASSLVAVISILATLIAIDSKVAVLAFLGFGGSYGLLITLTRRRLIQNSRIVSRNMTMQVKILQEGLGSIRDILLDNSQSFYCEQYSQFYRLFCKAKVEVAFLAGSPRYVMESLGMVLIAVFAYSLSQRPEGGATALPLLGTLALGAQRLLPALQQIFAAWASLRGDQSSIEDVLNLLNQPLSKELLKSVGIPLTWNSSIELDKVSFRYGDSTPWVIQNISLMIPKGYRVGFVGTTGSGKSTTMDLIISLLKPTKGNVLVDGIPLSGDYCRAWQKAIAHVPQHIYLTDTSIAENIALGVSKQHIDLERVRRAAQQAKIADFVEQEADGYWAELGERGIRLSGGQRQRIGIARALYKEASVLIFDEATSALDNTTEREVMAAIDSLGDDLTVLIIAHRLSTVERCDLIFELSNGRLVAQGTYQELMEKSITFQHMAMS